MTRGHVKSTASTTQPENIGNVLRKKERSERKKKKSEKQKQNKKKKQEANVERRKTSHNRNCSTRSPESQTEISPAGACVLFLCSQKKKSSIYPKQKEGESERKQRQTKLCHTKTTFASGFLSRFQTRSRTRVSSPLRSFPVPENHARKT